MFTHACMHTRRAWLCATALHRDSGVKAIEQLMEKRGKFDYILLETTGLADPGRFVQGIPTPGAPSVVLEYTCVGTTRCRSHHLHVLDGQWPVQ